VYTSTNLYDDSSWLTYMDGIAYASVPMGICHMMSCTLIATGTIAAWY
jgi:hypothetical protein